MAETMEKLLAKKTAEGILGAIKDELLKKAKDDEANKGTQGQKDKVSNGELIIPIDRFSQIIREQLSKYNVANGKVSDDKIEEIGAQAIEFAVDMLKAKREENGYTTQQVLNKWKQVFEPYKDIFEVVTGVLSILRYDEEGLHWAKNIHLFSDKGVDKTGAILTDARTNALITKWAVIAIDFIEELSNIVNLVTVIKNQHDLRDVRRELFEKPVLKEIQEKGKEKSPEEIDKSITEQIDKTKKDIDAALKEDKVLKQEDYLKIAALRQDLRYLKRALYNNRLQQLNSARTFWGWFKTLVTIPKVLADALIIPRLTDGSVIGIIKLPYIAIMFIKDRVLDLISDIKNREEKQIKNKQADLMFEAKSSKKETNKETDKKTETDIDKYIKGQKAEIEQGMLRGENSEKLWRVSKGQVLDRVIQAIGSRRPLYESHIDILNGLLVYCGDKGGLNTQQINALRNIGKLSLSLDDKKMISALFEGLEARLLMTIEQKYGKDTESYKEYKKSIDAIFNHGDKIISSDLLRHDFGINLAENTYQEDARGIKWLMRVLSNVSKYKDVDPQKERNDAKFKAKYVELKIRKATKTVIRDYKPLFWTTKLWNAITFNQASDASEKRIAVRDQVMDQLDLSSEKEKADYLLAYVSENSIALDQYKGKNPFVMPENLDSIAIRDKNNKQLVREALDEVERLVCSVRKRHELFKDGEHKLNKLNQQEIVEELKYDEEYSLVESHVRNILLGRDMTFRQLFNKVSDYISNTPEIRKREREDLVKTLAPRGLTLD